MKRSNKRNSRKRKKFFVMLNVEPNENHRGNDVERDVFRVLPRNIFAEFARA